MTTSPDTRRQHWLFVPQPMASGAGTNLKVGGVPVRSESGGTDEKIFLVVPLHFLALRKSTVSHFGER